MIKERAKKEDWTTFEMSQNTMIIDMDLEISRKDLKMLKIGYIPQSTKDKWFVYVADKQIFFHRNLNGYMIYKINYRKLENTFLLYRVTINIDQVPDITDIDKEIEVIKNEITSIIEHNKTIDILRGNRI